MTLTDNLGCKDEECDEPENIGFKPMQYLRVMYEVAKSCFRPFSNTIIKIEKSSGKIRTYEE